MEIFGIIIILMVIYFIILYNGIVTLKERVITAEADISVALDRRGKIFDSLINTVNKAMDYENSTLKEIISLRTKAAAIKESALSSEEKQKLEEELSQKINSGEFANALNITVEAYPELKANENLKVLQEEIISTENKLAYAKQAFNDGINKYNTIISSLPQVFIVNAIPSLKKEFTYWKLTEEKVKQEEERVIKF